MKRLNIKAILANPKQRQKLLKGATGFLIGVGSDFQITNEEAQKRADRLYPQVNCPQPLN